MRRTITVLAAGALALGGVAVAAPAANAAKVLKPGAVTAIKVTPKTDGTASVSWKAPVVKKGKTAKATAYSVKCGTGKQVIVKTTKAVATVTDSQVSGVTCVVTAWNGKVAGPATKSGKFSAYKVWGTTTLNFGQDVSALLAGVVDVSAPGTITANDNGSTSFAFPITSSASAADQNNAWTHAGGLLVTTSTDAGDITIPVGNLTVAEDPNSTFDVPLFDLNVTIPSVGTVPLLTLANPQPNADNPNEVDFVVTVSAAGSQVLATAGVTLPSGDPIPAGTPIGTGSSVWN